MTIRDWPADERPREKLLGRGGRRSPTPSCSRSSCAPASPPDGRRPRALAARRLRRPRPAPRRDRARFCAAPGLGDAKFAQLKAVLELNRRYLREPASRRRPELPRRHLRLLQARLASFPYEVFACLFLDNRHRVLAYEELFRAASTARACTRARWCAALHHNAAATIFSHNHPSGVAEPSQADEHITAPARGPRADRRARPRPRRRRRRRVRVVRGAGLL